jgi:hypothetical protein
MLRAFTVFSEQAIERGLPMFQAEAASATVRQLAAKVAAKYRASRTAMAFTKPERFSVTTSHTTQGRPVPEFPFAQVD